MPSRTDKADGKPQELDASGVADPADVAAREAEDDGKVTVPLAHHLAFGANGEPASVDNPAASHKKPGDKVRVSRATANAMIQAGLVAVHPDDSDAVAKLLKR